jgi:drug/metabolite transporter (DMT)-like permease
VVAMQSRLRNLWQPRAASGRVAVLFMAASCLGWAIVETVFGRHLQRSYDVMQIVWMRYAVHLLVVFGIWGWHQPSRIWRTGRPTRSPASRSSSWPVPSRGTSPGTET